jgi:nucleoside-diphosphate-sugar epimerase
MTTLVTGATGFIGSHLVSRLLAQGKSVRALIRPRRTVPQLANSPELTWIQGDLTNPDSLVPATRDIQIVFHAAALLQVDNRDAIAQVNIKGVENLLRACAENHVERFVFFSSVAAYAPTRELVINEDSTLGGATVYGRSKAEAERLVRSFAESSGLSFSIIRPCAVYGHRDYANFTPRLMKMLGRSIIPIVTANSQHMNLVHVEDVVAATILAGTCRVADAQAYNITGGKRTSLREICGIYTRLTGQRKRMLPLPLPFWQATLFGRWMARNLAHRKMVRINQRRRNQEYLQSFFLSSHEYDISKAMAELGYRPSISLEEGLRQTMAMYKSRVP